MLEREENYIEKEGDTLKQVVACVMVSVRFYAIERGLVFHSNTLSLSALSCELDAMTLCACEFACMCAC